MLELNSDNIVKLYDHFEDRDYLYMVLEYCDGGMSLRREINIIKIITEMLVFHIEIAINFQKYIWWKGNISAPTHLLSNLIKINRNFVQLYYRKEPRKGRVSADICTNFTRIQSDP